MENLYYVGIDVSKKTLDASIFSRGLPLKQFPHTKAPNDQKGYKQLRKWLYEQGCNVRKTSFMMEYTGVYSRGIRQFLDEKKLTYRMENPLEIKMRSGVAKEKNDRIDSARIADYLGRNYDRLTPSRLPSSELQRLEALNHERKFYVEQRTALRNRIQTASYEDESKRHQKQIDLLDKTIGDVEHRMIALLEKDATLKKNYELLCTIPGIGPVNAINAIVITENFTSFETARQYASYIGVAPHSKTSGKCVHWKPKPSNCSNLQAKADLSQAAESAILYDEEMKSYYEHKTKGHKDTDTKRKVLNHIKFKLVLRMFSVVKRQQKYEPLGKVIPVSLTQQ